MFNVPPPQAQATPLLQQAQAPQSQYLAQALQQMRQGQGDAPVIRTPAALGTNLLAEALRDWNPQKKMAPINAPGLPSNPYGDFSMAQPRQFPTGSFFGG